jgi:hypothetical protein
MTTTTAPVRVGQTLTGPLFNEPMRVETVAPAGASSWVLGLVGTQSERFRRVTVTSADLASLTVLDADMSFNGDGQLLRLGLQAYALAIAYEFDPYFGLSLSRVDPLPHQLKTKLVEFVGRGDFGLASGPRADGGYERLWHQESVAADEIAFEPGVVLLKKATTEELKRKPLPRPEGSNPPPEREPDGAPTPETGTASDPTSAARPSTPVVPAVPMSKTIRLVGTVPPELWNRLGTRAISKLRSGKDLRAGIDITVSVDTASAATLQVELRQILDEMGLQGSVNLTIS